MKQLLNDIFFLWRQKPVLRMAGLYLMAFLLLVLVLPWLPLPYTPTELDLDQVYLPPFQDAEIGTSAKVHWLGTDAIGRDVLAYTLFGARTAVFISFPVMLLTTVIGLLLGTCAGYFGNIGFKISRASLLTSIISAFVILYLGLYVPVQVLMHSSSSSLLLLSLFVMLLALLLLRLTGVGLLTKIPLLQANIAIPLDRLVLWLIETFTSIPRLVLILALASFAPPSVMLLSGILVITYWTGIARLSRAEILRIKQLPYLEAATSIGVSKLRILLYHGLPNLLSPILIAFVFGLSGLLAFESTLSFLGIGVPPGLVSWGKMIAGIRMNTSAWWLALFPGAFLLITVISLQLCSYYFLEMIRKRKN